MVRNASPLMRVIGSILLGYKVHPDGKVVIIAREVVLLRTPNGQILSGLWVIRTVLSKFPDMWKLQQVMVLFSNKIVFFCPMLVICDWQLRPFFSKNIGCSYYSKIVVLILKIAKHVG